MPLGVGTTWDPRVPYFHFRIVSFFLFTGGRTFCYLLILDYLPAARPLSGVSMIIDYRFRLLVLLRSTFALCGGWIGFGKGWTVIITSVQEHICVLLLLLLLAKSRTIPLPYTVT